MKVMGKSFRCAVVIALVTVCLHICAHMADGHCDHTATEHMSSATACLCSGHTHTVGMLFPDEPIIPQVTVSPVFDYTPLFGVSVPSDIFKPPLLADFPFCA